MNASSNILIPERLSIARKRLNLTKAEAARLIGLTSASYVRYESGSRNPSPQVLQSIAESLRTSVDFLTGKTDDTSPDLITLSKNEDPILFELINQAKGLDNAILKRLLSYFIRLVRND